MQSYESPISSSFKDSQYSHTEKPSSWQKCSNLVQIRVKYGMLLFWIVPDNLIFTFKLHFRHLSEILPRWTFLHLMYFFPNIYLTMFVCWMNLCLTHASVIPLYGVFTLQSLGYKVLLYENIPDGVFNNSIFGKGAFFHVFFITVKKINFRFFTGMKNNVDELLMRTVDELEKKFAEALVKEGNNATDCEYVIMINAMIVHTSSLSPRQTQPLLLF